MAPTFHTPSAPRRKHILVPPPAIGGEGLHAVAPASPTPHLDAGQYAQLLALVDRDGIATLDDISRALPAVERPISAVFDLCDAGIVGVDLVALLDGDTTVWRLDR